MSSSLSYAFSVGLSFISITVGSNLIYYAMYNGFFGFTFDSQLKLDTCGDVLDTNTDTIARRSTSPPIIKKMKHFSCSL